MPLLEELELQSHEQLVLAAAYLRLMNADLRAHADADRALIRDEFRDTLRSGALGEGAEGSGPLPVEADEPFEELAHGASDCARCLSILVELCASEPFIGLDHTIDRRVNQRSIGQTAITIGADVDEDDVEAIFGYLQHGQRASQSKALLWVLIGAGGIAGIATAGMAAPAIGAAIGGVMGLSGAAAAAAGLAWLGGGAVAAGGLGMAGGTMLIAATGGLAGAGVGALFGSSKFTSDRAEGESIKLFALCRSLDLAASRGGPDEERLRRLGGELREEMELAAEAFRDEAERCDDDAEAEALFDAAKVIRRLRQKLGDPVESI